MGNCLRAGSLSDLANWNDSSVVSMAKDIETAMAVFIPPPPDDKPDERRKFFMGLATGIINHLQNNQSAFTVQVPDVGGPTTTASSTIKVCP
jgi:hypothetical protein